MKKLKLLLLAFGVLPAVTATSAQTPQCYSLSAELLYWSPQSKSFDNFPTIFETDTATFDRVRQPILNPDYSPGFRLEGIYATPCWANLHARFTYFNTTHNRKTLEGSFPSFNAPGIDRVRTNLEYRYLTAEVLLGKLLYRDCNFDLYFQGGLNYLNFRHKRVINQRNISTTSASFLASSDDTVFSKSWGIGPEVVFDLEYRLPWRSCGTFALVADSRFALLASKRDQLTDNSLDVRLGPPSTFAFDVTSEPVWRVEPLFDFKAGANWSGQFCCFLTALEVGYEWVFYQQGLQPQISVAFQGPYFQVKVAY